MSERGSGCAGAGELHETLIERVEQESPGAVAWLSLLHLTHAVANGCSVQPPAKEVAETGTLRRTERADHQRRAAPHVVVLVVQQWP